MRLFKRFSNFIKELVGEVLTFIIVYSLICLGYILFAYHVYFNEAWNFFVTVHTSGREEFLNFGFVPLILSLAYLYVFKPFRVE